MTNLEVPPISDRFEVVLIAPPFGVAGVALARPKRPLSAVLIDPLSRSGEAGVNRTSFSSGAVLIDPLWELPNVSSERC